MDDLVHHCLRELAFDGDLGCGISRLRDFVTDFFAHHTASHPQNVDDAYFTFVWSLIVQQPTVRIGTIPPGVPTEVFIAPQNSQVNKAKAKNEEVEQPPQATKLDVIPHATSKTPGELKAQYGDRLRIAVDNESSFVAITGSHHRPSKLSPMVYTALQFITRGREKGISVVELGKKTQYDQRTCFYLVKQLIELDLVVKLRQGGVGSNFCIHKYFFERSPLWKQIRDEEAQAAMGGGSGPSQRGEEAGDVEESASSGIQFEPMEARHLSSLPLVRARIVKLLMSSKDQIHPSQNLLVTIVCALTFLLSAFPTRPKRTVVFFQLRLRELLEEGLIEKVSVPNGNKRLPNSKIPCIRLVKGEDERRTEQSNGTAVAEILRDGLQGRTEANDAPKQGLKANVALHKQIIDLLESTGTRGLTLNEISTTLGNFDKRTIELLLTRLEANPPLSHISDLGIAQLMESHARERRFRYYTVLNCQQVIARDKLDSTRIKYSSVDCSGAGGFAPVAADAFYETEQALVGFVDQFNSKTGMVRKSSVLQEGAKKKSLDPGQDVDGGKLKSGKKRKREEASLLGREGEAEGAKEGDATEELPPKKKTRRVPKKRPADGAEGIVQEEDVETDHLPKGELIVQDDGSLTPPVPKKRGRPPQKKKAEVGVSEGGTGGSLLTEKLPSRKRGRPRKSAMTPPVAHVESEVSPEEPRQIVSQHKGGNSSGHPSNVLCHSPDRDDSLSVQDFERVIDSTGAEPIEISADIIAAPVGTRRSSRESKSIYHMDDVPSQSPSGMKVISREDLVPPVALVERRHSLDLEKDVSIRLDEGRSSHVSEILEESPRSAVEPPSALPDVAVHMPMGVDSTAQPTRDAPSDISVIANVIRSSNGDMGIPIDPTLLKNASDSLPQPSEQLVLAFSADTDAPVSDTIPRAKRGPSDGLDSEQSPKRQKIQGKKPARPRGNVSQLRRENELLKVLESFNGIGNISSKDFLDAHMAIVESMTAAGEATSGPPGIRVDKRTLDTTFDGMERRGEIKSLKTSVTTPTGTSRLVRIVYLPVVSQEQLDAFLMALGRSLPTVQPIAKPVETVVAHVAQPPVLQRPALPLQLLQKDKPSADPERWNRNHDRATQLFEYDDATIRDVLLTEKSTLSQLYGYISGKAIRARGLHLFTLKAFELGTDSPRIISMDQRVVHLSFYTHDLCLAVYCSLVSILAHDEKLTSLLETDEGKQTLLKDLPSTLHASLQVGRARSRSRLLDLLHTLTYLKLVTPLKVSGAEHPLIVCGSSEEHPSSFDAFTDEWAATNPGTAPLYWHFNDKAPLHLWVLSETLPPFWKDMSIATSDEADKFWTELQKAATDRNFAEKVSCPDEGSSTGPADDALARTIRRASAWASSYDLTWHQRRYLRQFVDIGTGNTPLQDQETGDSVLKKVELDYQRSDCCLRRRARTEQEEKGGVDPVDTTSGSKAPRRTAAEEKKLLAKKAADAKEKKSKDWDEFVRRVHPEPLDGAAIARVGQVRVKYLRSFAGGDMTKWEGEILRAIKEAQMAAETVLSSAPRPAFAPGLRVPVPPIAVNASERSIEELIAKQGPPLPKQVSKRKKRGKKNRASGTEDEEQQETKSRPRRHRFQWNREYDELARDASVVINARCRNARQDLSAFDQIFPGVPRNSVRQRVGHMRDLPSMETYMKRLEDRWYSLWLQHRGTQLLPDPDPNNTSEFDLIKHIEFLRRHIDKNALRVGYVQRDTSFSLPVDLAEESCSWEVLEKPTTTLLWDVMWNLNIEEGREKALLQSAFVTNVEEMPSTSHVVTDISHIAESGLKMVFGTPNDNYDSSQASNLLHSIGEQAVSIARSNLLSRGVLSKLIRDPQKTKPGRTFKISEVNQNAIGGSVPHDTFQDASALEASYEEQESTWTEWPLMANDGDLAALVHATSEGKVDFRVDTSQPRAARSALDWNSKKADDDQIESTVSVHFHSIPETDAFISAPRSHSESPLVQYDLPDGLHGQTLDGFPAICTDSMVGVVDCKACLQAEQNVQLARMNEEEREIGAAILTIVQSAESRGVSKKTVLNQLNAYGRNDLLSVMEQLMDITVPLIVCAGYSTLVIVSSLYARTWTVSVSEENPARVFPRRWLDISGHKMADIWDAAQRAVMGLIVYRPGISQAEIRWRLRSVYDRQEISEILRYLLEDGLAKRRFSEHSKISDSGIIPPDEEEEKQTFWFLGDRHCRDPLVTVSAHPLIQSTASLAYGSIEKLFVEMKERGSGTVSLHSAGPFSQPSSCLLLVFSPDSTHLAGISELVFDRGEYKASSMRVKQIWYYVPLPTKLKLLWERLTVSRITTIYFVFSLLHCILQVIFQSQAFVVNKQAADFLYSIVREGNATVPGFFVFGQDFRYCDHVPSTVSAASCQIVWDGTGQGSSSGDTDLNAAAVKNSDISSYLSQSSYLASVSSVSEASSSAQTLQAFPTSAITNAPASSAITSASEAQSSGSTPAASTKTAVTVTKVVVQAQQATTSAQDHGKNDDEHDDRHRRRNPLSEKLRKRRSAQAENTIIRAIDVNGQTKVALNGFGFNNETVLDRTCVNALNWPVQLLDNTKREDIAFIGFQFWVLGMSIVALLNESIPHIIASLLTHLSATAWAGFQVWNTTAFHDDFRRLTTNGVCGINLLPSYWSDRSKAEIPSLALNAAGLLVSVFLSWRLIKLFGWQTFKRIGASRSINRIYKLVLILSIAIQLALFFVVSSLALWLDQLCNGAIARLATNAKLYKALFIIVSLLLTPWLLTGWFAVRRELKIPMAVFLVLSGAYLVGWGAMFDSTTFRWTFVQWRFFSVVISLSIALTLITFVLGIVCWHNFGRGLTRYLNAQEPLPGDDFVPVGPGQTYQDPEKVNFPSSDRPIPTFSATFGTGSEVPPPSQMRFGPRQLGPRFFNTQAQPFETSPIETSPITSPPTAHYGSLPTYDSHSSTKGQPLVRHGSSGSYSSVASTSEQPSVGADSLTRMISNATSGESIGGRPRWVIE
ncbi:hypothetical protein EW146_g465 [Bondarzewia mesenterica]|uniref:Uncharacterized protein n=1 Tax=Bondarzewia mesenterica TaxID=1095465 RepID=A0A4S4MD85_9AGAM|nr:hypothetical protein EW146_g465 [Bondarzewia mesenterica]